MHTLALVGLFTAVAHEIEKAKDDKVITVDEAIDIASDAAKRAAKAFGVSDKPLFEISHDDSGSH